MQMVPSTMESGQVNGRKGGVDGFKKKSGESEEGASFAARLDGSAGQSGAHVCFLSASITTDKVK